MDKSLMFVILIQIILICLFVYMLYIYITSKYTLKLEKRFHDYTVTSKKNNYTPFFEKLFNKIYNLVYKLSNILEKSEYIKKISVRYNKYLSKNDKVIKNSMDFISIKILIGISFSILYIISSIIRLNFNIMFLLVIFIFGLFITDIYYKINYKLKRKKIEEDLLSAIIIMNNAFKSGMNITEAVNIVASELSGPIKDEFIKISNDIKYGLNLETVFDRFYDRVGIEDIKYISSSLSLINKTGGNIVKVFGSIEKNFYDKKKIKNEMNSLTSSSKFMFRLLVLMPIILIFIILILNNTYFLPLINTLLGRVIILIMLLLYSLYIITVKLVMKVKYYE